MLCGGGEVAKLYPTLATLWTVTCQAHLSMGFSRQEYWRGLPFPSLGVFLTQGLNTGLLNCRQIFYHLSHLQRSHNFDRLGFDTTRSFSWPEKSVKHAFQRLACHWSMIRIVPLEGSSRKPCLHSKQINNKAEQFIMA